MSVTRAGIAVLALTAIAACNPAAPPASPARTAATSADVTGIAPRHAIVTLLPAGPPPPMPDKPALLDQISRQFIPGMLIVRVGQPVEFRNSEDTPHNVSVVRRESGTEVFNVGTEPRQSHMYVFDRVGQFDVTCDIHEGMEAQVIVARGPMTTIAGDDGRFSFANIAFGVYTASVTSRGDTVEYPIEVAGGRSQLKLIR